MRERLLLGALVLFLSSSVGRIFAQDSVSWHDPSPHTIQFIGVDENVNLEVLDWGGSGRPMVLLTGLGNTAHVFDDLAPKLTSEYHVYGITRRGYGASSVPATGYSADRLGDDVLAVLDALKLQKPVLVGHSIAGEEMSSIGSRHPDRVAALIYLDAGYWQAFYHRSLATLPFDLNALEKQLDELKPGKSPRDRRKEVIRELLTETLPEFEKDLQEAQDFLDVSPSHVVPYPTPSAKDLANFDALRSWTKSVQGIAFPEADLRQRYEAKPDGSVGIHYDKSAVAEAIRDGGQKYAAFQVPVLAIFANPRDQGPYAFNPPAEREKAEVFETAGIEAQAKAFESGMPSARVVRVPNANHFVFLSNEADVLREMRAFLATLH